MQKKNANGKFNVIESSEQSDANIQKSDSLDTVEEM